MKLNNRLLMDRFGEILVFFIPIGMYFIFINNMCMPKYKMKIKKDNNNKIIVYIKEKNYSEKVKIKNKNIDCLKKKGYIIFEDKIDPGYGFLWSKTVTINLYDKEIISDVFLEDCKECNVHTEIIYSYDDILNNEHIKKKKFYWNKCYKRELE